MLIAIDIFSGNRIAFPGYKLLSTNISNFYE